ncbi:quinone oxidoreductase family protein [Albidovulum sp.]|uniref:quinone oxidoreductase family protein n=1 Tax=Albidovulum sp. TaxID=1872424 RepID=UPI003D7E37D9
MERAIIARAPGGPEVLELVERPAGRPGPGEALVRHDAIGVNFIDIYFRSGLYPWPDTPLVPGAEAAGVVVEVGKDVSGILPGDRVAYVIPTGAYRSARIVPADRLVKLPDGIDTVRIAGALLKGLTAQYLVTASYPVRPGDTVLVHAAAGGVGLLIGPWLKALGARAIGTAGSAEKVELALAHGYDHVINYRETDFAAAVADLTGGAGCAAVYDSVGRDTWRGSLACLRPRGMFVNFGQSSGMIEGFQLSDLAKGSLSACRPVLFDFIAARTELEARAADLFARITSGVVRLDAVQSRPLSEAAAAHADLAGRRTAGSTVLIP